LFSKDLSHCWVYYWGYITSQFPFEQISVDIGSKKATGSLEKAFAKAYSLYFARTFYHRLQIINKYNFHLFWGDRSGYYK